MLNFSAIQVMADNKTRNHLGIIATDSAVGILPVEGRTPITVIGTNSISRPSIPASPPASRIWC
jgi:hypothetical protein